MDLKSLLSDRIGIYEVECTLASILNDNDLKQETFSLVFDPNDIVAYQAAWVLIHLPIKELTCFNSRQDELIQEVLDCKHGGKRRLILKLISLQPQSNPPRVDFLDFCLEKSLAIDELPGVRTLCMKIAYELCKPFPELVREFRTILEMIEPDFSPISIKTVRKNILKNMDKKK